MGSALSHSRSRSKCRTYEGSVERGRPASPEPSPWGDPTYRPPFTEAQNELVQTTWRILREDMTKVGVVMFIGLFETHPDVQDMFLPFRNLSLEEMKQNAQLRGHALKVMGTVEKALARMEEPEKLAEVMHALGQTHAMHNVKPELVDLVGPQFVRAIRPALADHWTPDVDDAWLCLFRLLTYMMQETMRL